MDMERSKESTKNRPHQYQMNARNLSNNNKCFSSRLPALLFLISVVTHRTVQKPNDT